MSQLPPRRLYSIKGPDDLAVDILGLTPLLALAGYHAEALGGRRYVRVKNGRVWFKRREHQALCAGVWVVTRQAINGDASASITIEIPPPD